MKKWITLIMACILMFSLAGCKKTEEAEDTQKVKEITSVETEKSMEGVTLKVGVSPDMAPFTFSNKESGEMEGFDIDLLDAMSEYLGFEYVLVVEPIYEIEKDLEAGKLDCAISGIAITDTRQEKFKFTDSYFENSMCLAINSNVVAESKKDIVNMRLGTEKGTSEHEYLNKYLKKYHNKIITYPNMTRVYRALNNGKIDAIIYDTTGVEYYMKKNPECNIIILEDKLYEEQSDYGIMCVKDFKYINEFNIAMKQMDFSGKYQELYDKWFKEAEEETTEEE